MSLIETLAILFLGLVALSRGVAFVWPRKTMRFFQKLTKTPVRYFRFLSVLTLLLAGAFFYVAVENVSLEEILVIVFASGMLFWAWFLWNTEFWNTMISMLSKRSDTWMRFWTGLAVTITMGLLYLVLTR